MSGADEQGGPEQGAARLLGLSALHEWLEVPVQCLRYRDLQAQLAVAGGRVAVRHPAC